MKKCISNLLIGVSFLSLGKAYAMPSDDHDGSSRTKSPVVVQSVSADKDKSTATGVSAAAAGAGSFSKSGTDAAADWKDDNTARGASAAAAAGAGISAAAAAGAGSAPMGGAAASSQELTPFKRAFSVDVARLIARRVVFWQGLENKGSTNVALVCKDWSKTVKQEMEVNQSGWMAWYGIVGDKNKEIYKRFLQGKLLYRPNPASNEGMVTLSISALKNPLEGTFDLSNCGDTGQCLSIATGYRKVQTPASANKVEIWLTPRFLVDKAMPQLAPNHHIREIIKNWDAARAPIGIFWTWGGWNAERQMAFCNYLTTESMEGMAANDLLKKYTYTPSTGDDYLAGGDVCLPYEPYKISHFVCELK